MPQIRIIEHDASPNAQEDGQDGDDIGMNIKLVPKQGKGQTYRTREVHVEPFFSIL